jgi:hypothetical protein
VTQFSDTFPLDADGDKPAVRWSRPDTYRHTPSDGETYGLPTGARNGFWVLDLDIKGGKNGLTSLTEYIAANGHTDLPDTYSVRTRSGGYHFYWALPEGRRIGNRTNVLSGVDVRGDGGYVRAGAGYEVLLDVPPTDAPEWLIDLCAAKEAAQPISAIAITPDNPEWDSRIANAERYLAAEPPCVEGQGGDKQLWLVSLKLARTYELPIDTALELLEPYNARCQPPWSVDAMARKLHEAATKGTSIPGTFASSFLAPTPTVADAIAPATEWRQRHNPQHTYSWGVEHCQGGFDKQTPISAADLASMLCGPGAHEAWCGVWQKDLFNGKIVAVNPPIKLDAEGGSITKADLANIGLWIARVVGSKASGDMIDAAILSSASAASFHPVRDYLTGLPQKVPAILKSAETARMLFGCSPADAPQAVEFLRKWMVGAVSRAMRPGGKFDTALALVGKAGGERKSMFFETLAGNPEWYRSNIPSIEDPQKCGLAVRGKWIVELAELATMRTSQIEAFKEYMARRVEGFRSPYERCEVSEPRQFAIGATANKVEFLERIDQATQRRFWPIEVHTRIPIEWVEAHRDELWAEAYAAFQAGEAWYYENERELDAAKEHFTSLSPVQEMLLTALNTPAIRMTFNGLCATNIARMICERTPTGGEQDAVAKMLAKQPGVTRMKTSKGRVYRVDPLEGTGESAGVVVPFFAKSAGG